MNKEQRYQQIIDGKDKLTSKTWFTILMLIVFFPYGLYLMWKKDKFNKIIRIVITLFFVGCLIFGLRDGNYNINHKENSKAIIESNASDKDNAFVLEYGVEGIYGKTVIVDKSEEIEYFIPYGKYEIISKSSKTNKIYIVSDSSHINTDGYVEEDSVQEIDLTKETTFRLNVGYHILLTMTTKIEIRKMEEN